MGLRISVFLTVLLISASSTQAATITIGIESFSAATTVIDFIGPSANPYTEAGATFGSTGQNVGSSALHVTDFLNPVLNVNLPFGANRVGLTNRGALPLIVTLQLFRDVGLANPLDTLGPININPYDFGQPLTMSFLGVQSDAQFRSLRITATNSFSLADFRFEAVPEPVSGAFVLMGLAALGGLMLVKPMR